MNYDRVNWLCRECKTANTGEIVCTKCGVVRPSLPYAQKKQIKQSVQEAQGLYNYWKEKLPVERIKTIANDAMAGKKFDYSKEPKPRSSGKFRDTRMADQLKAAGFIKNGKPTV